MGLEAVLKLVQRVAGGSIDADAPLMAAGVDSLGAVELRNQLQAVVSEGSSLPSTLVFDHPTVRALSVFLVPVPQQVAVVKIATSPVHNGLATMQLSQMTATLPRGIDRSGRMAATALDTVMQVPASRWNPVTGDAEVEQRCRFAAFMLNLEYFDGRAFSTSVAEASAMDPQQRFLLEHAYITTHVVGLRRLEMIGSGMAVQLGITSTEFSDVPRPTTAYGIGGVGHCFAAGRVCYVLGLQGPCVAVDTACSSSIVACHTAMSTLQCDKPL